MPMINPLEKDFSSRTQVETVHVPPTSDAHQEFQFNVPIFDDTIEEDDEYFLLLLDVYESDVIEYDDQRMCVKLTIIADEDSKIFFYFLLLVGHPPGRIRITYTVCIVFHPLMHPMAILY